MGGGAKVGAERADLQGKLHTRGVIQVDEGLDRELDADVLVIERRAGLASRIDDARREQRYAVSDMDLGRFSARHPDLWVGEGLCIDVLLEEA